jgi:signal transduction histidine kinase
MLAKLDELVKSIQREPWAKGLKTAQDFWPMLTSWIEENVLSEFLGRVTRIVDEIVEINPDYSEPQILENATQYMVNFLGARSASVRIYDPQTEQMLSYGSYPSEEERRETYIPLEGSIAGEVLRAKRPCLVPNIVEDHRYKAKHVIKRKGVHSMMAIPLEITRFFPHERDTVGVIQIYYPEVGRSFTPLEIQVANLMAKRLSFVIARKKILSLHRTNEKKESIVGHIFRTLGSRSGIKMKDVFNRVIPELADVVNVQSCALFSVTDDLNHVVLEAGFPEKEGYHSIGKRFPINSERAFELLLKLRDYSGDSAYEIVTSSYVLVVDPRRSSLISDNMKRFALDHSINSILYIPLDTNGEMTHFITFDALDQRQRYAEHEIEIFLFLARELMKARKMERLDDILHDFKNPAIATAGFARRLKSLIEKGDPGSSKDQIQKYASILFDETSRLQELALSIYEVGEEQFVNLTNVLKRRFEINREAIREQLKQNVKLKEGPFDTELTICCYPIHLERVFDNLLNNATKAIPLKGGTLAIRTFPDGEWACAEITNTGFLSEQDRVRLLEGEAEGRGLYITHRIVRLLKGRMEIRGGKETTTLLVRLPLHKESDVCS